MRLVDLIRVATRRAPRAPASEFDGETISYGALYGSAVRLANGLRCRGFASGEALAPTFSGGGDRFVGRKRRVAVDHN